MYQPPKIALTTEHQQLVHNNLRTLQELAPAVQKMTSCGIDCQHYEALRQKLRDVNQELHNNFGNGQKDAV
jgi:hypothetical protein